MRFGLGTALTQPRRNSGGGAPPSPLADYTYIIPGSGMFGDEADPRSDAERSLVLNLHPAGPSNTFQTVRVALGNNGDAYTINRAYLMRTDNENTAITEDFDTGIVTVASAPVVIAAGTDALPTRTWLSLAIPTGTPLGEVALLIDAAAGSPIQNWGAYDAWGIGWAPTQLELLATNLTSGISFVGADKCWGSSLPIIVEFGGLSTEVCTLPFVGDSWIAGRGDYGHPYRPYSLAGRLNDRWGTDDQPIAPIAFGRSGFRTDETVSRVQFLLDNFDIRALAVQFNSLNDVLQEVAAGTCRTSWAAVEALVGSRYLLPFVAGGTNNAPEGWWTTWLADMAWVQARNALTNVDVYDNAVSLATGEIAEGMAYIADFTHLNGVGNDQWETDAHANIRAVLTGWGV
jgi:hypothetical protein